MSVPVSEMLLEELLHGAEPSPSGLTAEEQRAWERAASAAHEALLARRRLAPPSALLPRLLLAAARCPDLRPTRLP